MNREFRKWTQKDIETRTYLNQQYEKKMKQRLKDFDEDLKKEKREKQHLCKYCFYLKSNLSGQAFTASNCRMCDKETIFPTTQTDVLCIDCAKENGLCKECGAEMD